MGFRASGGGCDAAQETTVHSIAMDLAQGAARAAGPRHPDTKKGATGAPFEIIETGKAYSTACGLFASAWASCTFSSSRRGIETML
jgi:hypothetical protein